MLIILIPNVDSMNHTILDLPTYAMHLIRLSLRFLLRCCDVDGKHVKPFLK